MQLAISGWPLFVALLCQQTGHFSAGAPAVRAVLEAFTGFHKVGALPAWTELKPFLSHAGFKRITIATCSPLLTLPTHSTSTVLVTTC